MVDVFLLIIFIVASFILLVKGANWLVASASSIARRAGVPAIIIGLTIVTLGTSLPEFFVSIFSVITGHFDFSVSTIVGSNILRIGLIIAIITLVSPMIIRERTLIYEFPFVIVSSLFLMILSNDNNIIGINRLLLDRLDGLILLSVFLIFFVYIFSKFKNHEPEVVEKEFELEFKKQNKLWKDIILVAIGSMALFIGARILIYSSTELAILAGVSEKFIGLSVLALGTSLPELFTSFVALFKKESDIALGTLVGGNIFTVLFVLGVSSLIKPIIVNAQLVYFDMVIMLMFSMALILFSTTGKKVTRWEGAVLLAGYIAYVAYLLVLK